ncbi:MAG: hypothetical protein ACR65W_03940 [Methylocystis sp.]|uniref:hypothetical protein n=1 Tax=Methylocystis sp. TaxID=1911079 RepID=UPI003DA25319
MDPLQQAKRFLLSHESSQVIDDLALKLAGKPIEEKRAEITSAAEDFAAELHRQGASLEFIRACRVTFEVLLLEKIEVAEAGGREPCRSH